MSFNLAKFNAKLLLDNPTYGRIATSDLNGVVKLVSGNGFSAQSLAAEMKKVKAEKWAKYRQTKSYLLAELPGLAPLLKGKVSNFKTTSLRSHMIGIEHRFVFVSDTGSLQDLEGCSTRERVSWNAPSAAVQAFMVADPHYRHAGQHTGMAYGRADFPGHQDVHGAANPFDANICRNYGGPPLTLTFNQVYEYSYDKVNWIPVPNSQFLLVRTLASRNGRGYVSMKKSSLSKSSESAKSADIYFP